MFLVLSLACKHLLCSFTRYADFDLFYLCSWLSAPSNLSCRLLFSYAQLVLGFLFWSGHFVRLSLVCAQLWCHMVAESEISFQRYLWWKGSSLFLLRPHLKEGGSINTKHSIDWDNTTCLAHTTNYFERFFFESWYTSAEKNSINSCHELPAMHLFETCCERRTNQTREHYANSRTHGMPTSTWRPRQLIFQRSWRWFTKRKPKRRINKQL